MFKLRNIVAIIIVNTSLLLLYSLYSEYTYVSDRIQSLDYTIDTAVDTAIQASMASEEFFYNYAGNQITTSQNKNYATLGTLDSNGKWFRGNLYAMCMYYDSHGRLPSSASSISGIDSVDTVYNWLYGNTETRTPTSQFLQFYNSVGKSITSNAFLRDYSGTSYNIVEKKIPVLTKTGLLLDTNLNSESNNYLEDLVSVAKSGKGGSKYYLTPYSLGVTYLDTRVLKPVIISHIEQLMRYARGNNSDAWLSANGCIETDIYDNSTENSKHILASNEKGTNGNDKNYYFVNGSKTSILNNGAFELDMNSIDTSVEYMAVDFYDDANWKIVNAIEGASPYDSNLRDRPSELKSKDTGDKSSSVRLVAKVTVSVDVHLPYKSSLLQWFRFKNASSSGDHFGIRGLGNNGSLSSIDDGVRYTYVTYTAISR